MNFLTSEEAITRIQEQLAVLRPEQAVDVKLHLYVTRFVNDVLDYCHREDFPETLTYTAAEILDKWADDSGAAKSGGPLKRLKQNDTEFEFAVAEISDADSLYEGCMAKIRPKLNLYRNAMEDLKITFAM